MDDDLCDPFALLLVEDHVADQTFIERLLRRQERFAFELTVVSNLEQAHEQLARSEFKAVLLDLTLPDSVGVATCATLLQDHPGLPVVVVTGTDRINVGVEAVAAGAQDYLVKGKFDGELLSRSIQYAVERAQFTRKLMQAELAVRRTERLASLGQMCAGIAHEINNPIAAVWGSLQAAQNLLTSSASSNQLADCMGNMQRSLERCSRIITSMLRFSRQELPERSQEDLSVILTEAIQVAAPYAQKSHIQISSDIDVPRIDVFVSPVEIEQVFVNLFRNAIEASATEIHIRTDVSDSDVTVCVSDDGSGFDDEAMEHAFDPFFTTRPDCGGTGLGLSVAHRIVIDHGGEIQIESGSGTTVRVTLPLAVEGRAQV